MTSLQHNDDAFATMLLMSQLSADREEIVRPLGTAEFHALRERVSACGMKGVGALIDMDMSAVRRTLGVEESEAYRLCVLLGRVVPLSYALERFSERGIEIVTLEEVGYPARLNERLGRKAPPMIYACGDLPLADAASVAVLSDSCARPDALECARQLIAMACAAGLPVVTGGEVGFGRLVERETLQENGRVISFLAGSLAERIYQPGMSEMIANARALAMSAVHPEAKYTVSHAAERSKCLYALSRAGFVVASEKGRGAAWDGAVSALRNGFADRVYVWDNPEQPGNLELITRGATPFRSPRELALDAMKAGWERPAYEQMSLL